MREKRWPNSGIQISLVLFALALPTSIALMNVTLIVLIALWLLEGEWQKKRQILRASKALKYYAGFLFFIGLSLLWSDSLTGGFGRAHSSNSFDYYLRTYLFGFMLVPIMVTSMREAYWKYILSAFLTGMFVSEMVSWGIFMEWIHYKHILPSNPSPFMHHTLYSIFLAVTVYLLLTQFSRLKSVGYRVFIAFFILSAVVNLFLNGGRLGQVAFFAALFVYIGMHYRNNLFAAAAGTLLLAGAIFATAYQISPVFQKRVDLSLDSVRKMYHHQDFSTSWGIRFHTLQVAKDVVLEHPLGGAGLGSAREAFLEKARLYEQTELFPGLKHLHNGYMQIAVETGIAGLLLFFLFLYRLCRIEIDRSYRILLCTVIAVYLTGFIGEPLLFSRKTYMLFNFLTGWFLWQEAGKRREKLPGTFS